MATKVHMEALSPTMEEGQVVQWLKAEGDRVSSGDILAEIETDKATMELVARGDGVLRKILLAEGGVAPVGDVIALIAAEDEALDLPGAAPASAPATAPLDAADGDSPAPEPAAASAPAHVPDPAGRIKASPLARRLAEESGLNLGHVAGSGPGGRVIKRDVEAALDAPTPSLPSLAPETARSAPPTPTFAAAPGGSGATAEAPDAVHVPLSQMRKTIAKRLVESIGPVPHFYLTVDVDMQRASEARSRLNRTLERDGIKLSFNDIVLKAVAESLARHPECNAHWGGDHIVRFNRVHLGVAVAIEDGLITPVIRDAHRKGIAQISAEVRELATRARDKKLRPDEYTGATFSVSNLGMLGIESFTAVINPPEAAILAVGATEDRPVVVDGELEIRPRMRLTLSCDHRVIDGAQGARFLATLKQILEEPLAALL
jgi:pyruvate dehydrogenase E2 component (dihydrolipoamide acetyltransferase)